MQSISPGVSEEEQEITVIGTDDEPARTVPTGSRIATTDTGIGFQAVSTRTGVAGMTPGSGMDPFAGGARWTKQVECRSSDSRLSTEAACRIHPILQLLETGSHNEARSAIDRFLTREGTSDEERYMAATLWYRLGIAAQDEIDREEALKAMLDTTTMPLPERQSALRVLALNAVARQDMPEAVRLFEQLVPIAPLDARSRANLASLYWNDDRAEDAERMIQDAISIMRGQGESAPPEWEQFLSSLQP